MSPPVWARDHELALGYGDIPILSGLNGVYRQGDRLVLIGANGAGKTTFLRSFVDPSRILSGRRELHIPRARIASLAQNPRLAWAVPCSVRDFLLSSLLLPRGAGAATRDDFHRLEDVLERTGLSAKRDAPMANLSGGQTQRLCFARALLLDAQILLLDEPFAAIDPESRDDLRRLLNELRASTLQILVLHDPFDVIAADAPIRRALDGRLEEVDRDQYRDWQRRRLDAIVAP